MKKEKGKNEKENTDAALALHDWGIEDSYFRSKSL